jgi:hypothetical protein
VVTSDELIEQATAILSTERARLGPLLPPHELVLTGGTSVPGALTKGDVDLHLRVDATRFETTVATLRGIYTVVLPEIWSGTLATFAADAPLPTGIAVTPIGSEHDIRFRVCWQLLAARPDLLAGYNEMKRTAGPGYEARKSAFFDRLTAGDHGR